MKSLFSVTFLFLSLNARADGSRNPLDELNSAIVDSVKESYQLPFNKGDAKFLPDAIVCNDKGDIKVTLSGVTQAKALLEGGLNDGST
ncbi:MAG TPA: hypothetical protein VN132_04785, partial [Bdellovibrio sp.]|nr:hypothetical protein [Bdellovibrio sp.]